MARRAANVNNNSAVQPKVENAVTENLEKETVTVEKTEKAETETEKESDSNGKDSLKTDYVVENKAKANKKLFGTTGKLIEFDEEGKACVDIQEALHFKKLPDYRVYEK